MVVWDVAGKPRGSASIAFSASNTSEPNLGHILENRRVLWAIYSSRAFRDNVTVLQGELTSLDVDAERVEIALGDGRSYTAQLAIGSDGSDSVSRKLAGIDTTGREYEQAAFVTHVKTELPHRQTAWQRFLPNGPIAFLPLADGRSSIVWTTKPAHAQALVNDPLEQVGGEIEAAIDGVLGKVTVDAGRACFPLRMMHAHAYCAERFALVGDAAHTVHPLAGQGVNLGFLDSAALIEVLADALREGASLETFCERRVLRRYERWRKSARLHRRIEPTLRDRVRSSSVGASHGARLRRSNCAAQALPHEPCDGYRRGVAEAGAIRAALLSVPPRGRECLADCKFSLRASRIR
jgi:2-octaprenylphenol hydroxylase